MIKNYNEECEFNIADMEAKCYSVLKKNTSISIDILDKNKKEKMIIDDLISRLSEDVECEIEYERIDLRTAENKTYITYAEISLESCTQRLNKNVWIYRPLHWLSEEDKDYYIKKYNLGVDNDETIC